MRISPGKLALLIVSGLASAALLQAPGFAQSNPTVRVRGTVERLEGQVLLVKAREGGDVRIQIAETPTISGVAKASLADIKPGMFVGTAALGQSGGALRAVEVLIFPEGVKSNEGHYAWDLLPESTMTNATVADTVQGVDGPTLTLSYAGGEKKVSVPPDAPVVTLTSASRADLKPGASVFVPAQRQPDGTLTSNRVIVGNNGIAPPM